MVQVGVLAEIHIASIVGRNADASTDGEEEEGSEQEHDDRGAPSVSVESTAAVTAISAVASISAIAAIGAASLFLAFVFLQCQPESDGADGDAEQSQDVDPDASTGESFARRGEEIIKRCSVEWEFPVWIECHVEHEAESHQQCGYQIIAIEDGANEFLAEPDGGDEEQGRDGGEITCHGEVERKTMPDDLRHASPEAVDRLGSRTVREKHEEGLLHDE